jgi:N-dimethylarginine dimethylaminohydrolase
MIRGLPPKGVFDKSAVQGRILMRPSPRILMCPPDYYGIEYEINPWMSRSRGAQVERARAQWRQLYETLLGLKVRVDLLTPVQGLPDLVFTANAGLMFKDRFFSARFRHPERARESPVNEKWFAAEGFKVEQFPEGCFHEGAGDALFCGEVLFAGYRIRSDVHGHLWVGTQIGKRVLPVELINPFFYHLDTCFCPLAPGEALWFPEAFDAYGRKVIEQHIPRLLTVVDEEAKRCGCNAVVVGKRVITNSGCERLADGLRKWGYEPIAVELDEFLKAGGSAKCLTLRIDGEEAATW